jgi:hypothetical protein
VRAAHGSSCARRPMNSASTHGRLLASVMHVLLWIGLTRILPEWPALPASTSTAGKARARSSRINQLAPAELRAARESLSNAVTNVDILLNLLDVVL